MLATAPRRQPGQLATACPPHRWDLVHIGRLINNERRPRIRLPIACRIWVEVVQQECRLAGLNDVPLLIKIRAGRRRHAHAHAAGAEGCEGTFLRPSQDGTPGKAPKSVRVEIRHCGVVQDDGVRGLLHCTQPASAPGRVHPSRPAISKSHVHERHRKLTAGSHMRVSSSRGQTMAVTAGSIADGD